MTPQEKAEELVEKFYNTIESNVFYEVSKPQTIPYFKAKQCALICVDEIIKTDPQKVEYIGDRIDPLIYEKFTRGNTKYWQEVKQELLKQ